MKTETQKVLIVDDHTIFREGLRELIDRWDDFQVIGEAKNGRIALHLCRKLIPNIVLMDITMPVMNGVEATRRIRTESPATRVIMLTMSVDEKDLFEAIKAGAQGYVLKDVNSHQLHNSLRGVIEGDTPLSGPIATKILEEFRRINSIQQENLGLEGQMEMLTERESLILQYVVDGMTNAEISKKLFLSEVTIKKALSTIMLKFHVKNRVQATAYALREGLAK